MEALSDVEALQRQDLEDRYQTTGVSWPLYLKLLDQLGGRPGFRITELVLHPLTAAKTVRQHLREHCQ